MYAFDPGQRGRRGGLVDVRIGFGIYQFCRNRGSVGRVYVFGWLWCRWGVGRGLGPGCGWWGGVTYV